MHSFTNLDLFNLIKFDFFNNNETLASVIDSLRRKNTAENHRLICQQCIGYMRCMYDMGAIEKNVYLAIIDELHWLKSECK